MKGGYNSNTPMRQRRRLPVRPRNISTVNTRSQRRARLNNKKKASNESSESTSTSSNGTRRSARIASISNAKAPQMMSARNLARKNTLFLGHIMELKDEPNPDDDSTPVKL